jgi:flagellar basal body rod protein FlgG
VKRWFRLSIREMLLATAVVACLLKIWMPSRESLAVRETGRELDIALLGEGYFCLCGGASGGFRYTRRGHFILADDLITLDTGATCHEDQWAMSPSISIWPEATDVRISTTGLVECWIPRTKCWAQCGTIQITHFPNPAGLREVAPGIFEGTRAAGMSTEVALTETDGDVIKQGWLDARQPSTRSAAPPRLLYLVIALLGGLLLWRLTGQRRMALDTPSGA